MCVQREQRRSHLKKMKLRIPKCILRRQEHLESEKLSKILVRRILRKEILYTREKWHFRYDWSVGTDADYTDMIHQIDEEKRAEERFSGVDRSVGCGYKGVISQAWKILKESGVNKKFWGCGNVDNGCQCGLRHMGCSGKRPHFPWHTARLNLFS